MRIGGAMFATEQGWKQLGCRTSRVSDERGQGLVEYALVIAIVSLGAIAALGFLSDDINGLFSRSGNSLENATLAIGADGSSGSGGTGGGTTSPPTYDGGAVISCAPEVVGACVDTGTMSVDPGTWSGDPAPTFAYEWFYNQSGNAAGACTLSAGDGWVSQPGSSASHGMPDIPSANNLDSMGVRVTGSNTDPGSPATTSVCRQFESPAEPSNDQNVDSSMSLVGGGTSAATVVGSFGGRWYSQTINGNGSAPNISGGAVMRDSSFSGNPTDGDACGFTLTDGFAFTGKTWHQAAGSSNDWDEPGNFFNDYEWACY